MNLSKLILSRYLIPIIRGVIYVPANFVLKSSQLKKIALHGIDQDVQYLSLFFTFHIDFSDLQRANYETDDLLASPSNSFQIRILHKRCIKQTSKYVLFSRI